VSCTRHGDIITRVEKQTARPGLAYASDKLAGANTTHGRKENMADAKILSNQKTILTNQATIVKNQKTILANQHTIVKNQKLIFANQGTIKKNQAALTEILKNQKEILAAVKK
jgi:hypothetical protein